MSLKVSFLKGTQEAYDNLSVKNPRAFYVTEKNVYLGEIQLNDSFDSLFAAVAFSGSYADLENKPNIPSKVSELENDLNFSNFSGNYNDLSNKPDIPTKVSELENDSNFTSFSGSYNDLTNKPEIPIKISDLENDLGFTSVTIDTEMSGESTNPVQNKIITAKIIEEVLRAKEAERQAVATAKEYTDSKIADLVNSAPEELDTIKELADAITNNQSVIDTINLAIVTKVDKEEGKGLSENNYTTQEKTKLSNLKNITFEVTDSNTLVFKKD